MKRFVAIAVSSWIAGVASAQTSELYLTTWGNTTTYVVQNGQIVRTFQRASSDDGPGLVVQATIKTFGQYGGAVGHEYDLNGLPLAGTYPNAGFVDCYDGATDGTRNWTISHNDFGNNFAVLVGDADWNNMQVSFVPLNRSSGIAWDATDDTLWISNNVGGSTQVEHYTTAGALLGQFPVNMGSGGGYGIALDPADGTLWLTGAFGTTGRLDQHDKNGALLQSVMVPGLTVGAMGAEFRIQSGPVISPYCTAGTSSNGCVSSIAGTGTPSASAPNGFTITVTSVEGQRQGILFYGVDNAGFTPTPWGTGSSFLCVKAPVQRTGVQSSGGTGGLCNGQLSLDWNAFRAANPGALGSPFAVGDDVYAQAWYRDPPSPKTTVLSDGLKFTLAP